MPLEKLALLLVAVIAAAGVTVALGAWAAGAAGLTPMLGLAGVSIVVLLASVLLRRHRDQ
ncbi:hypothetical protein [Yoonia vestfoldensis]|uniref:hypothetical protein n=1 Tax=Yoonia vestfoldensis TaxID=245188 RepID=UPI000360069D|nr:hypothetical protein [Yoonia vestfoldensis]